MPLINELIFFLPSRPEFLYRTAFNFPQTFSDSEPGNAFLRLIFFYNISEDTDWILVFSFPIASGVLRVAKRAIFCLIEALLNVSWLELIALVSELSN